MSTSGFLRTLLLLTGLEVFLAPPGFSSEIAHLKNGRNLAIQSHQQIGNKMVLLLEGTDHLEFDEEWIDNIVPVDPPAAQADCAMQAAAPKHYSQKEIREVIKAAAQKNRLAESLLSSLIQVESNFDPWARSPKGAQGLMQLMPETVALYKVKNIFDVRENVEAGARYLKDLLQQFNQNLVLALAAYNAGPSAVVSYKGVPPFPETEAYVRRVLDTRN
jgi:soluble lytic murein transglycosylase-like protein